MSRTSTIRTAHRLRRKVLRFEPLENRLLLSLTGQISGLPATVVEGDTVTLSASATGGTAPYRFDWSAENSSAVEFAKGINSQLFNFPVVDDGDNTVYLTTTDAVGAQDTRILPFAAGGVAPSIRIVGTEESVGIGDSVTLTAEVIDPGVLDTFTYAWTALKDGLPFTTGTSPQFVLTPDAVAEYTVSLSVTDDDGLASPPASTTIFGAQSVSLITAGVVPFNVTIATGASSEVQDFAATLANYLGQTSGDTVNVATGDGTSGIAVGLASDFPALGLTGLFDANHVFRSSEYLLRTHAGGLQIIGATDEAVEFGIWDVLYRMGHRHFQPGDNWQIVPSLSDYDLAVNNVEVPDFPSRGLFIQGGWFREDWHEHISPWMAKNRFQQPGEVISYGHAWGEIVADYKANNGGVLPPSFYHDGIETRLDLGSPAVIQMIADFAIAKFQADPDLFAVSVEPYDGHVGSAAQLADFLAGNNSAIADPLVNMANQVIQMVRDHFNDGKERHVALLAYANHSPPPSIQVDPDVIIQPAQGFYTRGLKFDDVAEGWRAMAPTNIFLTYAYGGYYTSGRNLPNGSTAGLGRAPRIAQQDRDYDFSTYMMESGFSPAENLGHYLTGRTTWDVDEADRQTELINEFLALSFAEAQVPMRRYYDMILGETDLEYGRLFLAELYEALDEANQLATDPGVRARIGELIAHTRYAELWANFDEEVTTGQLDIGEVGQIADLTHQAQTITLDRTFNNPVVFAQSASTGEADPVVVRVDNVQSNQFDIWLAEPSNLDGTHGSETVTYLVLEAGTHQLLNGTKVEVGTVNMSATFPFIQSVGFQTTFDSAPVVLTQIQTTNGAEDYLQIRQPTTSTSSVSVRLQPAEDVTSLLAQETVGYLAMDAGDGTWGGLSYKAGLTPDAVTDSFFQFTYSSDPFESPPSLLTSLASSDDNDNAHVRTNNSLGTGVELRVEEDTTADAETAHDPEEVAYLAFGYDSLEATTNLMKYVFRMKDSYMISTRMAWISALGGGQYGEVAAPGAENFIFDQPVVPDPTIHPWYDATPFTDSELEQYVAGGIIDNALPFSIERTQFSSNLVSTEALNLTLPAYWFGGGNLYAPNKRWYIWQADSNGESFDLHVIPAAPGCCGTYALDGPLIVSLYKMDPLTGDKIGSPLSYYVIPFNSPNAFLTLTADEAGLYLIEFDNQIPVDPGSGTAGGSRALWPDTVKISQHWNLAEQNLPNYAGHQEFFYVPKGTTSIVVRELPAQAAGFIYDPFGNVAHDLFAAGTYAEFPVPAGADGKLWFYEGGGGTVEFLNIPSYFAQHVGQLLLPAEVVQADSGGGIDADFDSDGDTDGGDFLAWQRGFPIASGASRSQGDADGNGTVDAIDVGHWEIEFGSASVGSSSEVTVDPLRQTAARWLPVTLAGLEQEVPRRVATLPNMTSTLIDAESSKRTRAVLRENRLQSFAESNGLETDDLAARRDTKFEVIGALEDWDIAELVGWARADDRLQF